MSICNNKICPGILIIFLINKYLQISKKQNRSLLCQISDLSDFNLSCHEKRDTYVAHLCRGDFDIFSLFFVSFFFYQKYDSPKFPKDLKKLTKSRSSGERSLLSPRFLTTLSPPPPPRNYRKRIPPLPEEIIREIMHAAGCTLLSLALGRPSHASLAL